MAQRAPRGSEYRAAPLKDRRARSDSGGTAPALSQLKSLFVRPIALELRGGRLRVVLMDRRKSTPVPQQASTAELCAELSARLLAHDPGSATQSVRFLVAVHDALGRKGWPGVAALPAVAITQSAMLVKLMANEDPSPLLDDMLERLAQLRVGAEARDDREARRPELDVGSGVQVSESDFAEFDSVERSWEGTVPDGFARGRADE